MIYSSYQIALFNHLETETDSVVIGAVAGSGKCLGINTPVLMFDGSIRKVQDIKVGDQLMGPDSLPRNVLSTNVGNGNLCQITPVKGDSWICNDVHVMTLVNSPTGKIFDISLDEYRKNQGSRLCADAKLFRVEVSYPELETVLDPYFAGLWLGDGTTAGPSITNQSQEVHDYLIGYAPTFDLTAKIKVYKDKDGKDKCPKIDVTGVNHSKIENPIRDELLNFVVNGSKRIPKNYLINSQEKRLALLAGLLDSDGYLGSNCYEISTKLDGLKDDILHLCRGLGFAAYATLTTKSIKSTGFSGLYWVISISGHTNMIPCKIEYKKAGARLQKKNVLRTGFSITDIGVGDYYGFTLDGDGRFLLGDHTVTHNTTTIIEACNRLPEMSSKLFLAFNTSIVGELKAKLPKSVNCRTFNSCGWGAWLRYTGKKNLKLDEKKTWNIIWDNFQREDQDIYGAFVNKMVALAKSSGLTPEDHDDKWWSIQDHHGLLLNDGGDYDRAMFLAKKTLRVSNDMGREVCDFDDQIYLPWLHNVGFDKYDVVFVDELQDTNEVQAELLKRMLNPGGRLVGVGDEAQAIYGFRGAGVDSMRLIQNAFGAKFLPLSISYRCCKAVVAEAQRYVSTIESFENAPEGQVETLNGYNIDTFTADDAILCRNNAPLIAFAYALITRGKGVNFLGRDIGGGLKTLVRNMEAKDLNDLSVKLDKWYERESAKLRAKKQEDKIELLNDRVQCIGIFMQYLPESKQTVNGLVEAIDALFERKGGITLSSIHKSKGREWARVFILDFGLCPSKWALKSWQKIQENNLIYVAITRAKQYLGYINSDSWTDEPNLILPEKKVVEKTATKTRPIKVEPFNPFN